MEIIKGVRIEGECLFLVKEKTLIFGDVHIGLEESMRRSGVHIPTNQFKDIYESVKNILEKTHPKLIIINGDLKHNFGTITNEEWDKIAKLLKMMETYGEVKVIKGNHDAIVKPITDKLKIPLIKHIKLGGIYICHGDVIPLDADYEKAKTIIIGHEHPAVSLRDGARSETYKCYLKGKYEKKELIVMPSLNPISEGSDILSEKPLSPFLKKVKLGKFRVFVVGEEIYDFGNLSNIEKL